MNEFGAVAGEGVVRFERLLPGPIERVWQYIADAEYRRKWLAGGTMTTKVGESFQVIFRHDELSPVKEERPERFKDMKEARATLRVLKYDPPHSLTITWDETPAPSEVTFDLTSEGKDVRLVLTHRKLATKADMIGVSGGWHTHLGTLEDNLNNRTPRPFWTEWKRINGQYEPRFKGAKGVKEPVPVTVTRHFDASAERVFDAWLDPVKIGKWMFGPPLREEEVLHTKTDPKVGGSFSFLVRRQGMEIDHIGKYFEIDRPRRLVFSWGTAQDNASSRVIIEIAPTPSGCDLTLTHEMDPDWAHMKDRVAESWAKMLASLAAKL
jgi:uncharacterized protein YndB with AHSA1/START domain